MLCVTHTVKKQDDNTVIQEQMMVRLSESLAMTDGGTSEKSIKKITFIIFISCEARQKEREDSKWLTVWEII